MAVVVRYSTLIVRKAAFDSVPDGDLDRFRKESQRDTSTYYEDSELIAVSSMGGHERFESRLVAHGLPPARASDVTRVAQGDDIAGHAWLEHSVICGYVVCWLRGKKPGYVVDCKSVLFNRDVAKLVCNECSSAFTIEAAAQAIDVKERQSGPLAFVNLKFGLLPNQAKAVITCTNCEAELVVDAMDGFPI